MAAKEAYDWSGFSALQRRFVIEYLIDYNASAAAARAGSTAKADSLKVVGHGLLHKEHVRAAIDWHIDKLFAASSITAERILRETAMIAFADMAPVFNPDGSVRPFAEWPEHCRRVVAGMETDELFEGVGDEREQVGITKKFRQWDKMKALELLGKNQKMWTDKVEISDRPKVVVRRLTGRDKAKAEE